MALHDVHCRPCVLWANQIENGELGEALSMHGNIKNMVENPGRKRPHEVPRRS